MARGHPADLEQELDSKHTRNKILQQAQTNRRVSFIPVDTTAGATDAETPWDISNTAQLQQWAQQHPTELLQALNELRQERDAALSCIEEWNDMVEKVDTAQAAALSAQGLKREALKKVKQLEADKIQLELETEGLEETIQGLHANVQQSRLATPSSTSPVRARRSKRPPDPPLFTEVDGEISLEDWIQRVRDKLTINKDHYEDDAAKAIYVISRTGGTAAQHIQAYRTNDPNHFTSHEDVIQTLSDIMGDPHKKDNMRRGFKSLRQKASETVRVVHSDVTTEQCGRGGQERLYSLSAKTNRWGIPPWEFPLSKYSDEGVVYRCYARRVPPWRCVMEQRLYDQLS
ncbi:hypothetical protein N7G274_010876 [Stereocaulon virgatum]|uniref:Uncharacterized protein n=1 Tax=Stereocaulon virgatum TaxID=373712 RepID=A0ABR3ZWK0_9LECA